ncbi:hypothetical protein E3N88_32288 [Mikania micrantha]|uniref:Uncharacterized protein n=1 Tax=Mikania micrantha TaxID=192012 RepID=A0A5N6M811_9ASTR|nr:hypothetical protein E3N88_32288 [Mikania micrantha]
MARGSSNSRDHGIHSLFDWEEDGILADTKGAKTSKFDGALHGIPISMMVDSGVARNFLSQRLVIPLGLPVCSFDGISIKLGNGANLIEKDRRRRRYSKTPPLIRLKVSTKLSCRLPPKVAGA